MHFASTKMSGCLNEQQSRSVNFVTSVYEVRITRPLGQRHIASSVDQELISVYLQVYKVL